MANIYELFASRWREADPFILDEAGQTTWTYGDLAARSARYANLFLDYGLTKGDRVMVQVEKSVECLAVYLACLRSGLIYLPLNTAYGAGELAHFIDNATPALILCDPAATARFAELTDVHVRSLDATGGGSLTGDIGAVTAAHHTPVPCSTEDVAVISYTSGTTGKPKGAMITHGNFASNGLALHEAWGWQPGDVMLHALPIFHIHGLFVATHLPLLNGSPIVFLPRFDPDVVVGQLPTATVFMGVPTYYVRLLAHPGLDADTCRNMRLFTSGSAPLLAATFDAFRERTGHVILERYGMTETGMNTSNPLNGERKAGTVGMPLPGVVARIIDEAGKDAGLDTAGDLLVKGPNVFRGYWQMPDKTAEDFTDDGFFRTGDVASIDGDGYISIVGRNKDMIISGGLNIYPKEIETLIDDMPGVDESAVIGIPHADFGEAVTAVIVREAGAAGPDAAGVTAHLREHLANFKVAKTVHFVDALPRNAMGKVQKNVLRDRYADS